MNGDHFAIGRKRVRLCQYGDWLGSRVRNFKQFIVNLLGHHVHTGSRIRRLRIKGKAGGVCAIN